MKKRYVSSVVIAMYLVLISGVIAAYAEEQYQTAVSGLYSHVDGDQGSSTISYGLSGREYFTPVKTDGHPYSEASFLERIGSMYGVVQQQEFKSPGRTGDGPFLGIELNATKPGFPLAIELFYNRSMRDYDPPSTLEATTDIYGTRAGYFITDTGIVGIQHLYSTSDNESAGYSPTIIRQQQYGFFTKYDHDLGENKMVSLQATLTKHTTRQFTEMLRNTEESLSVDYYFTRSLSAGVEFKNKSGTEVAWEGKTWSAGIQYYVTRLISVNVGFSRFLNANDGKESSKSYTTGLSARF